MKPGVRRLTCRSLLALTALATTVLATPPVGAAATPSPQTTPLDMVVAVDESGSLKSQDVAREITATSTIAQGVLNPQSRVTVLGFGSDNGKPGQHAVDQVCRPTTVDGAVSLQYLSTCTKGLHRRSDAEGNDTDHVAALSQALSTLRTGAPPDALKVIFLLTDGKLDVRHSPSYGSGSDDDPQVARRRNEAATAQLATMIGQAKQDGVQIWPLGFGAEATQAHLDGFAAGASRQACDGRSVSQPRARIVRDSQDVTRSLYEVYASALCYGISHKVAPQPLEPGESRDLKIDIPVIATDGTIVVDKGDPRVRAEFIDPKGRAVPAGGTLDDASFTRSGDAAATEALRIVNPVNGTWTVRLHAPKALAKQLVSATAFWQGAVQATIVSQPPAAQTGQQVTVWLSLVTRRGAITDEHALSGLSFSINASGPTLPGGRNVAVRDDGKAPDDVAHDGRFTGRFTAPAQAGDVSLTGVVSGPAIRAERVPTTVQVSPQSAVVGGSVEFDAGTTVHPGDVVHGKVTLRNATNAPKRVHLELDGAPDAKASVSPATAFDMAPGDSARGFAVRFGRDAKVGRGAFLTLKLVDDATPSTVYANGLLTVTITAPPTVWDRIRPYVVAAAVLLVLVALALWQRRRAWRRRVAVKGLYASLRLDGERVGPELKAPSSWSQEFRFTVRDVDGYDPRLHPPRADGDDPVYTARRSGDGAVLLRTPDGDQSEITFGAESEPLPNGHRIAFRDARKKRRGRRPSVPRRRPPARPASAPADESPPDRRPPQPTTDYDDIWY